MINQNFLFVGFLFNLTGSAYYTLDTLKGKVKPNRVTYVIWSLAPLIIFVAQIQKGVGFSSLFALLTGLTPLITFIATFFNKNAVWKLNTFDLTCGALSIVGLFLWAITKEGNMAILFSIIADGLGTLPTVVKSYTHPQTETPYPYATGAVYAGVSLLILKKWNFSSAAFSLYYFLAFALIFFFTLTKIGKGKKLFFKI